MFVPESLCVCVCVCGWSRTYHNAHDPLRIIFCLFFSWLAICLICDGLFYSFLDDTSMRFWPVTSTKNKGGGGRPSNEEGLRFDFLLQKKKNKVEPSSSSSSFDFYWPRKSLIDVD